MRRRLTHMIETLQCGDIVFEAGDFERTMEGLSDIRPDVLILDIRMPGGTGIDVLKTMQFNIKPPMVIVFTNYYYPQYFERCMKLGADYFFDKSIDVEKLVNAIKNFRDFTEAKKSAEM